ncbi:MAG: nitrogenase component 1 [Lachnospiraceae bacterium]|nr:nitrogenase component 1 [Lachnospiraceae bacterium]
MNRSYRIIPVYTGDVSGVASALFEMGGMVVIHDPSGCNSTYNTHDETRWYDSDSLIYITGLSNTDAIMGDDEKLIREVEEAAEQLKPDFIALTSSPIPYMNGTDFPALAKLITRDTGIPAFFAPANGMHDYVYGAGQAFLAVAKCFLEGNTADSVTGRNPVAAGGPVKSAGKCPRSEGIKSSVNILGATPLEFAAEGSVESLREILENDGWKVQSCWAMGESPEQLRTALESTVNLVVSATGFPMARYLEQSFGIPWVAGCPVGGFAKELLKCLRDTEADGQNRIPYLNRGACSCGGRVTLVGEPVTMGSLAAAITEKTGMTCSVLCPVEADPVLTGTLDIRTYGEEEAEAALKRAKRIVADPLYRPICPADAVFCSLPHQAFSGRCFRRDMVNLFQEEAFARILQQLH